MLRRSATRGRSGAPATSAERPCPVCGEKQAFPVFVKDSYRLVRCAECDLLFVGNPPTADELERLYSFASGYHVELRDDPAEIANRQALAGRQLAAVARHRAPGRLLDIGAAAGFFVRAAVDGGWDAQGIELSPDTAAVARERYGVRVESARLEDTDFAEGSFDAVTLWDVIEHVENPGSTMAEVARLLSPSGVVGLLTPNIDGLFPRWSYPVGRRFGEWPSVDPPGHLSQFSVKTLGELLRRTGFEILDVEHEAQPLSYTFGSVRKMLRDPRRLAYTAVFAPVAAAGPRFAAGDEILVTARKA